MADNADNADDLQETLRQAREQSARHEASKIDINGTGTCIVCNSDVEPINHNGKKVIPRWCSKECRDLPNT